MTGRVAVLVALALGLPSSAWAAFPYRPQGAPDEYSKYFLKPADPRPDDLSGKRVWMYASTPEAQPNPLTADRRELNGVRGAWLVDTKGDAPQAWHTTTGRPDVTIAVLDSGVMWNDRGKPMNDVRLTTRISQGETPAPQADRTVSTDPRVPVCAPLALRAGGGRRDLTGDGVFNVSDYACDSRVNPQPPNGVGLPEIDPQDVLIAFSDGDDDDSNGYVDDMVGWDFLDDDNDPFDDVQYGHGSGEAAGAGGEADNGGELGTCPNCMLIHMRVGSSFIADVNAFALATIYAADNDVEVVQEALGTLNKTRLGADAVKYAYDHGVTVIASAADEAAQHHNWPSSYPYSIVVNSVTHADEDPTKRMSYLMFNGCTNFSSRVTLAIPSVSCSSDATERAAGMAGLVYAAAYNARDAGKLAPHPTCRRTDGSACAVTANEVRQLMASGTFDGQTAADDVNFAQDPVTGAPTESGCGGQPVSGCTDPFFALTATAIPRLSVPESYPARKGHDQFYGYGRVNMHRAVTQLMPATGAASRVPPEAEVESPGWYDMVDPREDTIEVRGHAWARGAPFACDVYIAAGAYPHDDPSTATPPGDFVKVPGVACNGQQRTDRAEGVLARVPTADLKKLFPATSTGTTFDGPEGGLTGQTPNPTNNVGRPNDEPYSFVVKVVARTIGAIPALTGSDRRQAYLHHDKEMLEGFPKHLAGDVESSPVLADLDGDNRNDLVVANSDGIVHAYRAPAAGGGELPGWPVTTDVLTHYPQSRAFRTGAIAQPHGAVLGTPAVGDLDRDGTLEVVVADLESKVYVFDGETGTLERKMQTNMKYSGRPLRPFENVRGMDPTGQFDKNLARMHRMEAGFIASPVLADVDRDDGGRLEIVAAAMDRHVYVWNDDGSDVPGWPLVVIDHAKLRDTQPKIHPETHRPFIDKAKALGEEGALDAQGGAIIDTPAVGDLDGDGRPEIVVGTNEVYRVDRPGEERGTENELNAGGFNEALYEQLGAALELGNGRLYAIRPGGDPDGPNTGDPPWLPGWPFKVGILQAGVLPLVGEGITGAPVLGRVPCDGTERAPRVGVIPAAGLPYVVNADGKSCYGRDEGEDGKEGKDIPLNTEGGLAWDPVFLAAFGHPIFAELAGGTAFLAPAAGVTRAADVVLPEYQGGQDYLVAWDLQLPNGTVKPGWPGVMNDLQFLTGPSAADISAVPGQEVLGGSAHHDLQAFTSGGNRLAPDWPKLTGDWSVANPTIGTFGTLDTAAGVTRVVVHGTRNGRLLAYRTAAPPCGPASWPRFHHDLANSGDFDRDATPPGKPMDAALTSGKLEFSSPGDDLLCGTPAGYEVRTSDEPITPASFASAAPVQAGGDPVAAGSRASLTLPAEGIGRYVAVRARDDQGNVGRPAVVDRGAPPGGDGGGTTTGDGGTTGTGDGGATGDGTGGGGAAPAPGAAPGGGEPATGTLGAERRSCFPRSSRIFSRGIGRLRITHQRARIVDRIGPPASDRRGVMRWCVRGGGRLVAVLSSRGDARLVLTTGRRHGAAGGTGPGDSLRQLRRYYPQTRRTSRGLHLTSRSTRLVFKVRRSRIEYVAIVDRRLIQSRTLLLRYLRRAGVR